LVEERVAIDASDARTKHAAPSRSRKRVADARTKVIPPIRCTAQERVAILERANKAGLSVGAYLRTLALGSPGPRAVRRPPVERRELARILGQLGKVGSNVNQLAHAYNRDRILPGFPELLAIREDVREMRAALMGALGRDHQG
jgi:Bacterial mobilisation protein (MobC)